MNDPNTNVTTTPAPVLNSADIAALAIGETERDLCTPKEVIRNRWIVIGKLGGGCFGQIYTVKDTLLNKIEALKVERAAKRRDAQLPMELQVLKKFQGKSHATELYGAGTNGKVNYIIMQLAGDNLAHLRRKSPAVQKRFSLNTSIRLAKQCLEAIEELHSIYVVHRDIKPSNFAMGRINTPTKNTVFMIDFGLARFYADSNGNMRPERKSVGFRGTVRYCSLTAHYRQDLGRKDDLISHFYMLVEFLEGTVPWKEAKMPREVMLSKERNDLPSLFPNLKEMKNYGKYLKTLEFSSTPAYSYGLHLLDEVMKRNKIYSTDLWDWENDYKLVIEEEQEDEEESSTSKSYDEVKEE